MEGIKDAAVVVGKLLQYEQRCKIFLIAVLYIHERRSDAGLLYSSGHILIFAMNGCIKDDASNKVMGCCI